MGDVAEAWVPPSEKELVVWNEEAGMVYKRPEYLGRLKFNEHRQKAFLECLEEGKTRWAASQTIGVSYSTIWQFQKICPPFEAACTAAEMSANAAVESALFKSATEEMDVRAQLAWLYSRWPERWKDMRRQSIEARVAHEVSGDESLNDRLESLNSRLAELGKEERAEIIEAEVVEEDPPNPEG